MSIMYGMKSVTKTILFSSDTRKSSTITLTHSDLFLVKKK